MGPLLALLINIVFLGLVFGGVLFLARHQRDKRDRAWTAFADSRGLTYDPPGWLGQPRIVGTAGGRRVLVDTISRSAGKSQVTYTAARARIDTPLPAGFSITREGLDTAIAKFFGGQDIPIADRHLDGSYRVKGSLDGEIAQALTDPTVHTGMHRMLMMHRFSRVEKNDVIVEERGVIHPPRLGEMLDLSIQLAEALSEAFRAPWRALAQQHGLSLEEHGAATLLEGRVEGLPVSIRIDRKPDAVESRFRVSLSQPLPGELELAMSASSLSPTSGTVSLGDAVLDSMLTATAVDPDAGRRLVAAANPDDDLHGRLLAVLHAHPRSVVRPGEVVLRFDDIDPARAEEHLKLAVDLAGALERAALRLRLRSGDPQGDAADASAEADAAARARAATVGRSGVT